MASGGSGWLRSLIRSGSSEFGAHDLQRFVVDAIKMLSERDHAGKEVLPSSIHIAISASADRLELAQRFVQEPSFDAEVRTALLNELYGLPTQGVPAWTFSFAVGEPKVRATTAQSRALGWLNVLDGDRAGSVLPIPALKRPLTLGRSTFHGDNVVRNDIVLSDSARFVSRRAAALHRTGSQLWLESRDQGDALWLERSSGEQLRPTNTIEKRLQLLPGDRIIFSDGRKEQIAVLFLAEAPNP